MTTIVLPEAFAAAVMQFLDSMRAQQKPVPSPLRPYLQDLFGCDPSLLSLVAEKYPGFQLPNVQLAIDRVMARPDATSRAIGVVADQVLRSELGNAIVAPSSRPECQPPREGPMSFVNVHLSSERVLPCSQVGVYLVKTANSVHAFFIAVQEGFKDIVITVQVMAREREEGLAVLADFNAIVRQVNVYRGHVLTVEATLMAGLKIEFAKIPEIRREHIILPKGVIERVERQTVQFAEHKAALSASGFHLKRGMLLYGPPGTGKTLTTLYLANVARGRTVILLTGERFGSLSSACAVARDLQPSLVIMEDVDLIAEDREMGGSRTQLHVLLEAMDGLEGDADIQFILTTNRVDVLERALQSRPGRIDLAIEIPLPDAECRRRIFELFSRGVKHALGDFSEWVKRTEGASATFIRELLRRAALESSLEGGPIDLRSRHLEAAITELVEVGGRLTRHILGFQTPE